MRLAAPGRAFSLASALYGLGLLLLLPYLLAQRLGDLRAHTPAFEMLFFAAFGGYVVAVLLALRLPAINLQAIFILAVLFRLLLIPTRPALSDDMYRYVWDGRVQA
ncbi:MAG: hypothetical protein HY326_03395, partial [Chloroflexi bacterium]|nr:hypothetical protein [Chloroflexota bacterium]